MMFYVLCRGDGMYFQRFSGVRVQAVWSLREPFAFGDREVALEAGRDLAKTLSADDQLFLVPLIEGYGELIHGTINSPAYDENMMRLSMANLAKQLRGYMLPEDWRRFCREKGIDPTLNGSLENL